MNIIEAIQSAENGDLISNNFMNLNNSFLKYNGGGVFLQYQLVNNKPVFKYTVRNFSMAEIISTGWEVLNVDYFKQ